MVDLVVSIDDLLDDAVARKMSPREKWDRLYELLNEVCSELVGLHTPNKNPVQIKLGSALIFLGYDAIEMVEKAGLDLFADYKLPLEVLDTQLSLIRALKGTTCIKRLTFRIESQVSLLAGRDDSEGATSLLNGTQFIPVGPVTDLPDEYYTRRQGFTGGRAQAIRKFEQEVRQFGDLVKEVVCAPQDIALFSPSFWQIYMPVTPAIRPDGLGGNRANSKHATNVEKAIQAGSSALIIGSPIMRAPDRRAATQLVLEQIAEATT